MFDRYQIVKIHDFLFFWGIFKWPFKEYFINKGASDFCTASNCTGAKKTLKYYFHKPCIDHLKSSLFSEGQLYCSHYKIHPSLLPLLFFNPQVCVCSLPLWCNPEILPVLYLIWIWCHYFLYWFLFQNFENKLMQYF